MSSILYIFAIACSRSAMMSSAFSMPTESDWEKAATWTISSLNELNENLDLYLQISYQGDAARIYADGILVEYNFWSGKPTLVRLSDLIGKHVELKILPFGKDYPIYLQAKEKEAGLPYPSLTLAFLAPDFAQSKPTPDFTFNLPLPGNMRALSENKIFSNGCSMPLR